MSIPASGRGQPTFWDALAVQGRVIGAIILRELHTRYGRDNVGYLWMILEPMTLALAVASLHLGDKNHFGADFRPVPFAVVGYCIFIIFRQIWNRAEGTLEANLPLLYHRMVTVFDLLFARAMLEVAGIGMTLFILLGFAAALGMGELPARPLALVGAVLLMFWFSFALSMLICAVTHERRTAARFVHPISYIMFPLSGAFYMVSWIPEPYRSWIAWFPMVQIFELARYGQFEASKSTYFDVPFIIGCNMALTYFGLLAIRVVRRHVHLH